MGADKKSIYLYDPINNIKQLTDYESLSGITGMNVGSLMSYKSKNIKLKSINSYIIDDNFTFKELRVFMEKEKIDDEVWKDIKDCTTGQYQISNHGRIRKISKHGKIRLLMPYKKNHCKSDWLFIKITRNSKLREWPIHRLVAEYYIPNEKNLPCVRHKNENITDNFAGNLEWVSHETLGKATAHKALGLPVLKIDVKTGHVLFEYKNMAEAGRDNYLHRETIRQVVRGIRKTAGGFYWRLANEDDFDYEEVYEEEA